MSKKILILLTLFLLTTSAKATQMTPINFDTIFGQGKLNPYARFFTGTTYLQPLNPKDDTFNAPLVNVTFEPNARTNWHKHSGGQILLILGGHGRYQERGGKTRLLKKGDIVRIEPNIEHWHGATNDSYMTHISLETNGATNQVTWLEPVNDTDYNK